MANVKDSRIQNTTNQSQAEKYGGAQSNGEIPRKVESGQQVWVFLKRVFVIAKQPIPKTTTLIVKREGIGPNTPQNH